MKKLAIVQERLPDYRVEFFEELKQALKVYSIELNVYYSVTSRDDALKSDSGTLDWARLVPVRRFKLAGKALSWQQAWPLISDSDGVVFEHASRHLLPVETIVRRRRSRPKIAWWGHGTNLQAMNRRADWIASRIRGRLVQSGTWFFAYTAGSAERFKRLGASAREITVVQNSTSGRWTADLATPDKSTSAAFLGALYPEKWLPLVIDIADYVHARVPGFQLKIIGDGPLMSWMEEQVAARPYIRLLGRLQGAEKAAALTDVSVILNPGLVGLVACDSFHSRRPIVTSAMAKHSPEYEYLETGKNSLVLRSLQATDFGNAVVRLLTSADELDVLREGCAQASQLYSLDSMVKRFSGGVNEWMNRRPAK